MNHHPGSADAAKVVGYSSHLPSCPSFLTLIYRMTEAIGRISSFRLGKQGWCMEPRRRRILDLEDRGVGVAGVAGHATIEASVQLVINARSLGKFHNTYDLAHL
jgi:hypothetical protein